MMDSRFRRNDGEFMNEQKLLIPGPLGELEAIFTAPESFDRLAIICHPHPLFQGTMHNKVVTTIAKAFQLKNYATLRFNYRGVGASAGKYGEIQGEIEDCLSVYKWAQQFSNVKISLAGFSFGAFISASVANQKSCEQLISVAPAVNNANFLSLNNIKCPWFVFEAQADELIPAAAVEDFVNQTQIAIELIQFPGASHFFHGKLIELREELVKIII